MRWGKDYRGRGYSEAAAIPFRGVHKSVEIFLDIDRLEEQAFVANTLGVFDQNSCGAIDAPHLKPRPKKSAVRVKFFQPRHRMKTIGRNSILASKAVIGPITDSSSVEQLLPFHAKIKRLFPDLVGPHMPTAFFDIHSKLQRLIQPEVSSMEIGHLFHFGTTRLPTPSKTPRCGLVSTSRGSQMIVNASKFLFLYLPRLNPAL